MNILHIINSTNPAGGGPIEAILQAQRELQKSGHNNEIVCMDEPGSPWIEELGMPVHALGPARGPYRYCRAYEPWLRQNSGKYDCAIIHGIWLYPSYGAWKVFRETRTPYFVYTHGLLDPGLRRVFPFRHLKKMLSWRLREHRIIRDATAVFFTCEEERDLAHSNFRPITCHPEIVPYCVGEPEGDPPAQRAAFLDRFPECRDKRLLVFLSRIHKKKGCDLLLEAYARAVGRDDAVRLVMVGPDSMGWQAELKTLSARLSISDRVIWTGMLSGDLKWGSLRAADAFALTSHQENFGIAVVEALACGAPVLISNRVNIWREIEQDGAGLVAKDEIDDTVAMLKQWKEQSDAVRADSRQKALYCFETRFRSDRAAENLLATLQRHGVNVD